jgi:hypothetical protein
MGNLAVFILEVVLCSAISFALVRLLKSQLRHILEEICGSATRAEFWVVFTQLMLFISPLLIVTFFTQTVGQGLPNPVAIFQETLFRSLLGAFIALSTIGYVIWTAIPQLAQKTVSSIPTEGTKERNQPHG